MPHFVYLLLGSNLGKPVDNLLLAGNLIRENIGQILAQSSFYQTAAWGNTQQDVFVNQVIWVQTECTAGETLRRLLNIENSMGRVRKEKWEPRLIDLDILFYDQDFIKESDLNIPHPYLHERRFTLIPLVEIAPDWVHPVLKKNMKELLKDCPDLLSVEKLKIN